MPNKADAAMLHILAACQSPYRQRMNSEYEHFSAIQADSEIILIAFFSVSGLTILWLQLLGFTVCQNWSSNKKFCPMLEVPFFKSLAVLLTNIYIKALLRWVELVMQDNGLWYKPKCSTILSRKLWKQT